MNRVALVIGNSEYLNIGKLNNPKNDANDIASILGKLNFDVEKVIDADLLDIQRSVNKFLQALDEYAVGLFFYAGHGMQIDGKNYIVPVDLKLGDKSRTTVSCYCLNSLLDGAATYKGKTLICILDACRDNPFAIGRGLIAGFAPFDNPPKGTIIAYSTGSDCSAFDGHGSNGLYTQVLKDAMLIPNLKIEDMFKSVRKNVSDISISQYGQEQLSWEYSSLVGDFYFSVTSQPVNEHISDDEIYTLNGEINCGKIKFSVSSNIPDGTPLLFTLRGKGYCAQCKSVVDNGVLVSEWFSDHGDAIKNGCYTVELSSPIYSILPERIQRIFGERNRNIYGSCVKFNPIGGNTIHCSFGLIIKEKSIHVIDFQEKISAL